jgi:DNA-binding transcriptional MerR regulator
VKALVSRHDRCTRGKGARYDRSVGSKNVASMPNAEATDCTWRPSSVRPVISPLRRLFPHSSPARLARRASARSSKPHAAKRPTRIENRARDDVARLKFIRRARELGFTLDQVRGLLRLAAAHGEPADAATPRLFDHLVGLGQQCRRDRQAKRLRRFHINCHLEFRRLLHRQSGRICTPHRIRTFKLSNDPKFADKLRDVVGLYVDLPAHAVVLSVDEKSQIPLPKNMGGGRGAAAAGCHAEQLAVRHPTRSVRATRFGVSLPDEAGVSLPDSGSA